MPPAVVLLAESGVKLFEDRERIVGRDKALQATFGQLCEYAFPATLPVLNYLMEHAERDALPHAGALMTLAAAIILGKPWSKGKDLTEGGQPAKIPNPKPVKPRPGGVAKSLSEDDVELLMETDARNGR
jgi:hypothetical protein